MMTPMLRILLLVLSLSACRRTTPPAEIPPDHWEGIDPAESSCVSIRLGGDWAKTCVSVGRVNLCVQDPPRFWRCAPASCVRVEQ